MADSPSPLAWRSRWLIAGAAMFFRVLAATWRFREIGYGPVRDLRARRTGGMYAFWHAQMLPLMALHRSQNIAVLISVHRDGERMAQAASQLGFRAIRGSTFRGAAGALRGLVRALRDGWEVAITPDGPRGPAEQFAPGAIIAAQQAGVPIVLLAATTDHAWRLRSWDRFMIPWPFARITVVYGEPLEVPADSPRAAADTAADFQARLAALNASARGR